MKAAAPATPTSYILLYFDGKKVTQIIGALILVHFLEGKTYHYNIPTNFAFELIVVNRKY